MATVTFKPGDKILVPKHTELRALRPGTPRTTPSKIDRVVTVETVGDDGRLDFYDGTGWRASVAVADVVPAGEA
jgi:hypothetical protein